MKRWLVQHKIAFLRAWCTIREQWAFSALVMGLLAVALSLPSVLWMLKGIFEPFQASVQRDPLVTVFLKSDLKPAEEEGLQAELSEMPGVIKVTILGIDEVFHRLDLDPLLFQKQELPLPRLLEVQMQVADPLPHVHAIESRYAADTRVKDVVFDVEWLHEWGAWSRLARFFFWTLSSLLLLMVGLIVANNVILKVQEARQELEIMSLIGAYASYMRRPFCYFGLILGAFGGLLAASISLLVLLILKSSLVHLAVLYQIPLSFWPHVISTAIQTLIYAAFFAGLSAFVAVSWQLRSVP